MAKILVVDDAAYARMRYKKSLLDNGYEVVEAANGDEAIAKYMEFNPDGVLLDINMPGRDGIATLYEILKLDSTARVIMVTAIHQQALVNKAVDAGARDYIAKPLDGQKVLETVRKIVG